MSAPENQVEKVYERFCRELDKEDELLKDRVNWLLISQAILFAAVGFSSDGAGAGIAQVVPWVGIALALAIWLSIWAAISSYSRYRTELDALRELAGDLAAEYPQLNRSQQHLSLGFIAPLLLPPIFLAAWLYFLFFAS